MQGIPSGFALTAVANYLAGKGLSSQSVGSFVAIVGAPWIIQFIWGPIIDRYQFSVIGHRKHWVVLTQLLASIASLSLLLINDPVNQLALMSVLFFMHSNFASVQDASVDAIAISIVPETQRGRVNAFMRGGYLLGISIGSAGLSTVMHYYGFFYAALSQSVLLLLMTLVTFCIKLDQSDSLMISFKGRSKVQAPALARVDNPNLRWLFKQLYQAITDLSNFKTFGEIAVVYTCISIFIRAFSFHLIHNLHWADNAVSVLQGGWGVIATLIVTLSGGVIADRFGPAKLQSWVMVAICLFLLLFSSYGLLWQFKPLSVTGLIIWNFADPMFSVASMPVLMLLCRKKIEGSQFTAYMAIVNFCDVMGSYISGWAMKFVNAPTIGFACGCIVFLLIARKIFERPALQIQPVLIKNKLL
ncbi:MFS transporter [Mucilaginibacter pallidiroseus]|uniref:MFS transporter n=2 Tax=Mucilaginibacter pallidiroseus TaxID=2599295 RepID=A0A563TZK6_9SPHI|nr:MFS transporter [Mucilaginibacter pallidiroseus]